MNILPRIRQIGLFLGLIAVITLAAYVVYQMAIEQPALDSGVHVTDPGWFLHPGVQVLGLLVSVIVVLVVLRPVMRGLVSLSDTGSNDTGSMESVLVQARITQSDDEALRRSREKQYELNLEIVRAMTHDEPGRVAQVLKNWINEN